MYICKSFTPVAVILGSLVLSVIVLSIHGESPTADPVEFFSWDSATNSRIKFDNDSIKSTEETFFIIHGWNESSYVPIYEQMAKNYLIMNEHCNVILVDYRRLAQNSYLKAFNIVDTAGIAVGNLIISLVHTKNLKPANTQIFGHSLGSHISGRAARHVKKHVGEPIARIAANDPAGPLFRFPLGSTLISNGLTISDAARIDATHTSYTMGTFQPFATVDFYFGLLGAHQLACNVSRLLSSSEELLFCDHQIAREYFAESILSCGLVGSRVSVNPKHLMREIVYGQHVPHKAEGIYIVLVNAQPPYGKRNNTYPSCKTTIMN